MHPGRPGLSAIFGPARRSEETKHAVLAMGHMSRLDPEDLPPEQSEMEKRLGLNSVEQFEAGKHRQEILLIGKIVPPAIRSQLTSSTRPLGAARPIRLHLEGRRTNSSSRRKSI